MNICKPIHIAVIGKRKVGKTTLLRALNTYADERGIEENVDCYGIVPHSAPYGETTIDYTELELESNRSYRFYEFSRLTEFYKCVLSGAIRIDAVLYVFPIGIESFRLDEESIGFIRKAGIKSVLGCFNVYDLDEFDLMDIYVMEYETMLEENGYADCVSKHCSLNAGYASEGNEDELDKLKPLLALIRSIEPREAAEEERVVSKFEADVYVLTPDESENYHPLPTQSKIQFAAQHGFIDCSYDTEDTIWPGDVGTIQCTLDTPRAVSLGSSFSVINDDHYSAIAKVTKLG